METLRIPVVIALDPYAWEGLKRLQEIEPDETLRDCSFDGYLMYRIAVALEREFGDDLSPMILEGKQPEFK